MSNSNSEVEHKTDTLTSREQKDTLTITGDIITNLSRSRVLETISNTWSDLLKMLKRKNI